MRIRKGRKEWYRETVALNEGLPAEKFIAYAEKCALALEYRMQTCAGAPDQIINRFAIDTLQTFQTPMLNKSDIRGAIEFLEGCWEYGAELRSIVNAENYL